MSIERRLRKAFDRVKRRPTEYVGLTGNGAGVVKVPGVPNAYRVRIAGRDEPLLAWAPTGIANLANLPIKVILDDDGRMVIAGLIPYDGVLPEGAGVGPHRLLHYRGGGDDVPIDLAQIQNLLVYPDSGLTVNIGAGLAQLSSGVVHVLAQTLDLTSHVPVSGTRWCLIYTDGSGTVDAADGTAKDLADLAFTDIPARPEGTVGLAAVRLSSGQTTLDMGYTDPDIWPIAYIPQALEGIGSVGLGDLSDVLITTPADSDVLTYDDGTSKWVNAAGGGGGSYPPSWKSDPDYLGTLGAQDDHFVAGSLDGKWAWVNQNGATADLLESILKLTSQSGNSNANCIIQTVTAGAGRSITAKVTALARAGGNANYSYGGVVVYDTGINKGYLFSLVYNDRVCVAVYRGDTTGYNWAGQLGGTLLRDAPVYFRISDDGTTLAFEWSVDGTFFQTLCTEARSSWLTSGFNRAGLFTNSNNNGAQSFVTFDWVTIT